MPRIPLVVLLAALLTSLAVAAEADRDRSADPGFEVLMDAGLVVPLGNLGAGLAHTATGLGVEQGYRAGLRCRYTTPAGVTLSPSFSFSEFGDHDGFNDLSGKTGGYGQKFKLQATVLRYGLDVGYLAPGEPGDWRALVAAGVGVLQNNYKEDLVDDEFTYDASTYSLGWMLSVGARRGPLELAMEYHLSSFETDQFFLETIDGEYTWNHLVLRAGWMLPRF